MKIWLVQWEDHEGRTDQILFRNEEAAQNCYDRIYNEWFVDEDYTNLQKFWQWANDVDHGH
jgi:hypothetical protein